MSNDSELVASSADLARELGRESSNDASGSSAAFLTAAVSQQTKEPGLRTASVEATEVECMPHHHEHKMAGAELCGRETAINEEDVVAAGEGSNEDDVTIERVSSSTRSSAAKKPASQRASTSSGAARANGACGGVVPCDGFGRDEALDVDRCCSEGTVSHTSRWTQEQDVKCMSAESAAALLKQMPLLCADGLPAYYYGVFTAMQEHLRDRSPHSFYVDAVLAGPSEVSVAVEDSVATSPAIEPALRGGNADSEVTCDDDEEENTNEAKPLTANNSAGTKRTDWRRRGSTKPSSPSLLDPATTSLFREAGTGSGHQASWVTKAETHRDDEKRQRHAVKQEEDEQVHEEKTNLASTDDQKEPTEAVVVTGDSAVADVVRRALQALYDREDALDQAIHREEDRLWLERLSALRGTLPQAVRAPSSAAPSTLRGRVVDVFTQDYTPSSAVALSSADKKPAAGGEKPQPLSGDHPFLVELSQTFGRAPRRAALEHLLRQRAKARAEQAQHTLLHRLQEHPCLVEDSVQYALLLAQLKAGHAVASGTATAPQAPTVPQGGVAVSGSGAAPTAAVGSALACGDAGQLLYLKYPPPLLRTTSFVTETTRLLKWLRTWRQTEHQPTTSVASTAAAEVPNHNEAVPKSKKGPTKLPKAMTEEAAAAAAPTAVNKMMTASRRLESCLREATAETSKGTREAKAEQQDRTQTSLLKFLGAAAKPRATDVDVEEDADDGTHHQQQRGLRVQEGTSGKAPDAKATSLLKTKRGQPAPVSDPSACPARERRREEPNEAAAPTKVSKTEDKVTATGVPALEPVTPLSNALRTYCENWRDAVNNSSSVTTTTTAASPPSPPQPSARLPAPRVATSLPFYDDMQKETGLLGSVSEAHYDRYGNRLRSARLAQREAQSREKEEERRRRREKKKGYFTRTDDEREEQLYSSYYNGGGGGASSDDESSGNDEDSGLGQDEITNIAVVSGPTGSGKTAAVYLAAHLLQFRVIEMNASVRRCPKNVERLLAELTRSYRLSGLSRGRSLVSIEEELQKLKREHAAMMAKLQAEADAAAAAAAAEEAAKKLRKTPKANAISAQAVAAFFNVKPKPAAEEPSSTAATANPPASPHVVDGADDVASCNNKPTVVVDVEDENKAAQQQPSTAADSSRTLLLLEDADVLLGDESMRPFYAAIRDLAQRSNVPLVVSVSSPADTEGRRYYDRPPLLPRPRDYPPCDDRMTAMDEATLRLDVEDHLAEANTFQHVALNARLAAHYFGRRTPFTRVEPMSRAALYTQLLITAAVELGLLRAVQQQSEPMASHEKQSTTSSVEGIVQGALLASRTSPNRNDGDHGDTSSSRGRGRGRGAGGRGRSCLRPLARSKKSTLVLRQDRGRGRGGSGKGSCSGGARSACCPTPANKLVKPLNHLDDEAEYSISCSTTITSATTTSSSASNSLGPHDADEHRSDHRSDSFPACAGAASGTPPFILSLVDVAAFEDLAETLRGEVFMQSHGVEGMTTCPSRLADVSAAKAGSLATKDVRYWLNRLQLLLLGHKGTHQRGGGQDKHARSLSPAREQELGSPRLILQTCEELSLADVSYGRYRHSLAHNDLHCPRQQYWQLDATVNYAEDVLHELDSTDHPTLRIDYVSVMPDPHVRDVDDKTGEEESDRNDAKRGRSKARKASRLPPPPAPPQPPAAAATAAAAPAAAPSKPSIALFFRVASPQPSVTSAVVGSPISTSEPGASAASASSPPQSPAPSLRLYCGEALQSETWRRPTELVLPYGDVQRWLGALDAEAAVSASAQLSSHYASSTGSLMAFPAVPPRPITLKVRGLSCSLSGAAGNGGSVATNGGGTGASTGSVCSPGSIGGGAAAGGSSSSNGSMEVLSRAQLGPQQAWWCGTGERMSAFKATWRRTRKMDNIKQFVVARSPGVVEDLLGFPSLTASSPSGSSSSSSKDVTLV